MSLRRTLGSILAAAAAVLAFAGPAAASNDVSVAVDRTSIATQLGQRFVFQTTISNHAPTATEPLIAHLNVLSLRPGVYVDPEDWSSQRTWYLGAIAAGEIRTITWRLQAVNAGTFAAYVAVLPQNGPDQPPVTGPAVVVTVVERRTINPGGVLPLALAIPALLALLAGGVRRSRRGR